jgi:hypothetical protein
VGSPIVADPSALANAQRSAQAVTQACAAAAGTVSALGGVALPDCDLLAAAWSRLANSAGAYVSAFGDAAGILGGKLGEAAKNYRATDSHVATAAASSGATP